MFMSLTGAFRGRQGAVVANAIQTNPQAVAAETLAALDRGSAITGLTAPPKAVPGTEPFKFLVCVDGSPQSRAALRFAALRARNTGGLLALLHISEPIDCREWIRIATAMEEEQRAEAELLLHDLAGEVNGLTGLLPEIQIRRGPIGSEILAAIREDGDIHALVVGAAPPSQRRGQLISWLASELAGSLDIPLVVVPGNLTARQIDRLA
ncbi:MULTISPECIES: universal stress protein [unclassified Azospirillum]|uniref:universal stress protein n=1 Tax=unclassified Azospirillum TaxID=2630922 RepID=UPI000B66281C|nr:MULTISPECIES: universal stress protein [unclassified Azospirillum]SNS89613.1 Nucleotide-binding universal stress protein, UspA family [Azospirillum sp. RU38E]SNT06840.1 Nucleotide-binding universal stress protein, UspA family [Azospirillum sp. RU37A]